MSRKFLSVSAIQTASRCWVPVYTKQPMIRLFSLKQRCINFNNASDQENVVNLISNDDTFSAEDFKASAEVFEPTIHSSEEIHTAGPVNKA